MVERLVPTELAHVQHRSLRGHLRQRLAFGVDRSRHAIHAQAFGLVASRVQRRARALDVAPLPQHLREVQPRAPGPGEHSAARLSPAGPRSAARPAAGRPLSRPACRACRRSRVIAAKSSCASRSRSLRVASSRPTSAQIIARPGRQTPAPAIRRRSILGVRRNDRSAVREKQKRHYRSSQPSSDNVRFKNQQRLRHWRLTKTGGRCQATARTGRSHRRASRILSCLPGR